MSVAGSTVTTTYSLAARVLDGHKPSAVAIAVARYTEQVWMRMGAVQLLNHTTCLRDIFVRPFRIASNDRNGMRSARRQGTFLRALQHVFHSGYVCVYFV